MDRILCLDTETTGMAKDDTPCEIAWIEVDEALNEIDRVRSLINPGKPISPGAMGVHHITDEMVADAPSFEEFMRDSSGLGPDDGVILVAHNAAFDKRFIESRFPRILDSVCTLRLARNFWPDAPDHKLQTLRYHLGLDCSEGSLAHSALGDCEVTLALLRRLCDTFSLILPELRTLSRGPLNFSRMPYGKHRGKLLKEIDAGYRAWMVKQPDLDPDLRHSLAESLGSR
jgi:exodeoxyribonuclease X